MCRRDSQQWSVCLRRHPPPLWCSGAHTKRSVVKKLTTMIIWSTVHLSTIKKHKIRWCPSSSIPKMSRSCCCHTTCASVQHRWYNVPLDAKELTWSCRALVRAAEPLHMQYGHDKQVLDNELQSQQPLPESICQQLPVHLHKDQVAWHGQPQKNAWNDCDNQLPLNTPCLLLVVHAVLRLHICSEQEHTGWIAELLNHTTQVKHHVHHWWSTSNHVPSSRTMALWYDSTNCWLSTAIPARWRLALVKYFECPVSNPQTQALVSSCAEKWHCTAGSVKPFHRNTTWSHAVRYVSGFRCLWSPCGCAPMHISVLWYPLFVLSSCWDGRARYIPRTHPNTCHSWGQECSLTSMEAARRKCTISVQQELGSP